MGISRHKELKWFSQVHTASKCKPRFKLRQSGSRACVSHSHSSASPPSPSHWTQLECRDSMCAAANLEKESITGRPGKERGTQHHPARQTESWTTQTELPEKLSVSGPRMGHEGLTVWVRERGGHPCFLLLSPSTPARWLFQCSYGCHSQEGA